MLSAAMAMLPEVTRLDPEAMLKVPLPASTVRLPLPLLTSDVVADRSTPVPLRLTVPVPLALTA